MRFRNPPVALPINRWRREERPRERLLAQGAHALSDAELISLSMRSGGPGRSAVDVARDALSAPGGLHSLLEMDNAALTALNGFGPAAAAGIAAARELQERYLARRMRRGNPLKNSADTRAFLSARLRGRPYEVFACLYLDQRNRVIRYEEPFRGTIDSATVPPREVVRQALDYNAAAIIFAHNHPSGVAEPSQSDRWLTERLKRGLALVDIRVLDHIVIGDGEVTSFSELGLL